MALHQVGLEPEAGLARTRAADDKHVFVAGVFWVLRPAVQGQGLGGGQDYVVFRFRVHVWLNIFLVAP